MRRKMMLAALLILVAVLTSGCMVDFSAMENAADPNATAAPTMPPMTAPMFTDRDKVYEMYNEVEVGDTLDELKERYGEPSVATDLNGETYTWTNDEGYGFAAVFYDNGVLRAKVIQYEDMRQLRELSMATSISNFSMLDTKDDFAMACMALGGKPCELATIVKDASMNPDIEKVFIWMDEFDSNVQILFNQNERIVQISYALSERE